jgi:hypothetical protein
MMVDLSAEMAELWASLRPPAPGQSRVVQFVAAQAGEGTSTVAREFARLAAARAQRPVWLVESDLAAGAQYRAVEANAAVFGAIGRATASSPDGSCFFTVQPPARGADGRPWPPSRYLVAYPLAGAAAAGGNGPGLWVTRFRREALRAGQAPHLIPLGDYWSSLRRFAEYVIVDSPSIDRSDAARMLSPFMDCSLVVMSADQGDPERVAQLKSTLIEAGGQCAGLVLNRAEPPGRDRERWA